MIQSKITMPEPSVDLVDRSVLMAKQGIVHRFYRYVLCAIPRANPNLLSVWVDFDLRPQLPSVEQMVNELVERL